MLQRVLAALLCLLGLAAIGLGVASATLWRASDTLAASATPASGTTMVVTAPGVLDLAADEVTVRADAPGAVVALGRTSDVEAWVGDDAHAVITGLADLETLATDAVAAVEEAPADGEEAPAEGEEAPAEGEEAPAEGEAAAPAPAPDPRGSDLWIAETSGEDAAQLTWQAQPGRWSVLVASTGESATAPTVTLTWPQEVTTPWLLPGVGAGAVLLLAGLTWLALLVLRSRREQRGPAVPARVPATVGAEAASAATPSGPHASASGAVPLTATTSLGTISGPGAGAGPGPAPGQPLTRRQLRELERTGQIGPATTGSLPVVPPAAQAPAEDAASAAPRATGGPAAGAHAPTPPSPPAGSQRATTGTASADAPERASAGPALGAGVVPAAGRHAPPTDGARPPVAAEGAGERPTSWVEAVRAGRFPTAARAGTERSDRPAQAGRPAPSDSPAQSDSPVQSDSPAQSDRPSAGSHAGSAPVTRSATGASPSATRPPAAGRPPTEDDVAPAFRSRLAARFARRPRPDGDGARADAPPAGSGPAPTPVTPAEPVWTPRPGQQGAGASADAWRRAWGFAPGETEQRDEKDDTDEGGAR
ncbi:hypothetical protein GXB85_06935 [Cellulomonas sp. APG4]|uniref:hypothetical protein n=1 Tax=Cellulomonas sp. APG4 TaxID=1538656 RepID=UPI001379D32D|nr:hypothetical protein [Cellulomonas sp. APG4]NCT90679.1 hypothetical protein [Cellulomonas sp. APG4]